MGRIKTTFIKSKTKELMQKHQDSFDANFEENKTKVSKYTTVSSKKIRNIIAGYITRLKKKNTKFY